MPARHTNSKSDQLREKRIESFRRVCRDQGLKVTPQRLEIFPEVISAHYHPSAEDIFKRVMHKLPMISLDIVYRTLTTFDQLGLIVRVHFLEDRTRFDPNTTPHRHLVCTRWKGVTDFDRPEIDAVGLPSEAMGWGHVNARHVQIRGVCAKCLSALDAG